MHLVILAVRLKYVLIQFAFLTFIILIPVEAFAHLEKEGVSKGNETEESPILSRYSAGGIQLTPDSQSDLWRQLSQKDIQSLWQHEISMRTLNNGTHIFFLLTWSDPTMATEKDLKQKADGAAIIFEHTAAEPEAGPQMDQGELAQNQSLMENKNSNDLSESKEVKDIWYWSTGAEHDGAARISYNEDVITKAQWNNGNWTVIIGRQIQTKNENENIISFLPGVREESFIKFIVWDGSKGESFEGLNDEALHHYDFILLPNIDVYPKDVYVLSGILTVGAVIFFFVEQGLYKGKTSRRGEIAKKG